ncbi:hypothetical protein CQ14_37065 [Bradyrhizobium lablabi]|uniref:Uncharacterized protein n=1 Tax=Bradyrhizobium lablabi TaxID=722472 RepID=A0A0R3MN86_9BRAD|nr:hypothetical protein CQ14_37065 [Bradyrhizobium lablabi]
MTATCAALRACPPTDPIFRAEPAARFRRVRQIPADHRGGLDGVSGNPKQNEWHASDWPAFPRSGTNAA